eukprot:s10308_g1.t1
MQHTVTEEQLQSVRYVATDSPSEKLLTQLQNICPTLQALMLDPIHLATVYEYGFWNKKSSESKQLRLILRKCIAVDASLDKNYGQLLYDGQTDVADLLQTSATVMWMTIQPALCERISYMMRRSDCS